MTIRVVVADDHGIVRGGLELTSDHRPGRPEGGAPDSQVSEDGEYETALEGLEQKPSDIL